MDVNETPTLEADIALQQMKAYFANEPYKKAVFVSVVRSPRTISTAPSWCRSIHDDYLAKREAGAFVYDINDPSFRTNPDY